MIFSVKYIYAYAKSLYTKVNTRKSGLSLSKMQYRGTIFILTEKTQF